MCQIVARHYVTFGTFYYKITAFFKKYYLIKEAETK
jgi:hypothetical protein